MTEHSLLARIRVDPRVMGGKPVIAGTRLTVAFVLGLLAQGATVEDVLADYEHLTPEDLRACFLFAARSLEGMALLPPSRPSPDSHMLDDAVHRPVGAEELEIGPRDIEV